MASANESAWLSEWKNALHLLAGDLFLVEGPQDQRGGARVLERPHAVEVVRERAGAGDQRVRRA